MATFIPYSALPMMDEERKKLSQAYFQKMTTRRSIRHFSPAPVDKNIIENIIKTAGTAPSGAHKQPWTFCAISNPKLKSAIRQAAEKEEFENYHGRMSEEWLRDLAAFDTNEIKEFIDIAPWIIVVFKKSYDIEDGQKKKNYYVSESVGIACGFLLAAIHEAGLVALTHTPSPMNFLKKLLNRPDHETPFLLIPVGLPASDAMVPDLQRKDLQDISIWFE